MSLRSACALLAAPALLALTTFPALGVEPSAVADAIGAALTSGSNAQATYESAALDGGNVVIKGLMFTGSTSGDSVRFNETVVESPTEDGNGLFHSPRIALLKGTVVGEPSGTVGSVTATDVTVLDAAGLENEGFAEAILYRTAEIREVRVKRDSEPRELSVERIAVAFDDAGGEAKRHVTAAVRGLTVSPDLFQHRRIAILARARLRLEKLGYDALVFDTDLDGMWDSTTGTLAIRSSTLNFRDNATISATGTVGNLPDPRVLNDADVVSQVGKLEIHDLVARYEEASFVARVLDLIAREQEVTRDEYVEQLSQALPFLLAGLTHQAFREELIATLRTFFKDPRSFTLTVDPEAPISGNEIISIAKSALGTLPDRLKASVSADAQD